ncbi:MAG: nuclear transport factor 2 family protein [Pseudomonadota bacterium]
MSEQQMNQLFARVQRLEDMEAVRHTWRDYCFRLDSEDWEGLGNVYSEHAVLEMIGLSALSPELDGVYRGRDSIIEDFYKPAIEGAANPSANLFATGHISTNMQIDLDGDEASTLAYFFEIVANDTVLIGTYQHRMRREPDRWRFAFLRITVRYHATLTVDNVGGDTLQSVLAKPHHV